MTLFEKAAVFAIKAHEGMMRKGDRLPYIIHPFEVASIAATMTEDEEVLAAALLHDTIEDTGTTVEDIEQEFGAKVAYYVMMETERQFEDVPRDKSWMQRKAVSLEELGNCKDRNVKILWLSDKLSNMRSFYHEWKKGGQKIWESMNQNDPVKQAMYYRVISKLTGDLRDMEAWREFNTLVETVFKEVR